MRKLIVSMNVTLDGFMAGPNGELDWHFNSWNDEMADTAAEQLSHADTILLGRHTYEAMACYWPLQVGSMNFPRKDVAFAEMMNHHQKIVFSKRIRFLTWNNSKLAKGNIKREIETLKKQPGENIIIYGSGSVVNALIKYDLINEYQLWVHPIAITAGKPLFNRALPMKLIDTKVFSSGVMLCVFVPANIKPVDLLPMAYEMANQ